MFKIKANKNIRFSIKDKVFNINDDIRKDIRNDKQLWIAFKANIAMSFVDHYFNYKRITNKKYFSYTDIHKISNDAADYFLKLWISD